MVLIIANQNSAVSKSIAEYYARKRSIPVANVCYIKTTTDEHISRAIYLNEIAGPVGQCLKKQKLVEKVRYLVTTLGVPLGIRAPLGQATEAAAVDSELTLLYPQLMGKTFPTAGPIPNPMFGAVDEPFTHQKFGMYMVNRLAGYDFNDVRGLVDRSLKAENKGKIVLDLRAHGTPDGDEWLKDAVIRLPKGRVLLEDSSDVVYNERGVIGYASWGSNDKHRKQRFTGIQFVPGAIATEYVSTDGRTFERPPANWTYSGWAESDQPKWFHGSPQSLSADFVQEGVTGVSGQVYEPYLQYCPRPDYVLPAYIVKGRNLAESFYVGIRALSWMNIVIGDPLCKVGPAKQN